MDTTLNQTAFAGWPHCLRLGNGQVELVATTDVGPRIAHLAMAGRSNLFAVLDEQAGLTGGDDWRLYAGHRLWHAPQVEARTELPDNAPVEYAWDGCTLRLVQPVEAATGIAKSIELTLAPGEARVRVRHLLRNTGLWTVTLAPWALSALRPDGLAIVPHAPGAGDMRTPDRLLVLWPFTDGRDPRFTLGARYALLRQDPANAASIKVGVNANAGWCAYYSRGELLVKCCPYHAGAPYPDYGCSVEMYTCDRFLELETLGPLTALEPGASVEHVEDWCLFADLPPVRSEEDVDALVRPLAERALAAAA